MYFLKWIVPELARKKCCCSLCLPITRENSYNCDKSAGRSVFLRPSFMSPFAFCFLGPCVEVLEITRAEAFLPSSCAARTDCGPHLFPPRRARSRVERILRGSHWRPVQQLVGQRTQSTPPPTPPRSCLEGRRGVQVLARARVLWRAKHKARRLQLSR